jgi:cell division protein FtsB
MSVKHITIFTINFYILTNVIFGQNGIVAIYQINSRIKQSKKEYNAITQENHINQIKSDILNEDKIDLRYLEELLRTKYSFAEKGEKVVFLAT